MNIFAAKTTTRTATDNFTAIGKLPTEVIQAFIGWVKLRTVDDK